VRILALETSGTSGSVAAVDAGQLITQLELDPAMRSARALAPAVREVLVHVGWKPRDVQLVAVSVGPGSFTGLRLGVMTAKAFAYAAGAQILGVGSLDAIAACAPSKTNHVAAAIDAQRGEVYAGCFSRQATGELCPAGAIEIIDAQQWLESLPAGTCVTGPALAKLAGQLPLRVLAAPRDQWFPDAATVGRLAAQRYAAGARDDLWTLAPLYLRRSAAEEKWEGNKANRPVAARQALREPPPKPAT
jgi:tRNA threonylcarbamoyladenosine biosynthesis protein TsaB